MFNVVTDDLFSLAQAPISSYEHIEINVNFPFLWRVHTRRELEQLRWGRPFTKSYLRMPEGEIRIGCSQIAPSIKSRLILPEGEIRSGCSRIAPSIKSRLILPEGEIRSGRELGEVKNSIIDIPLFTSDVTVLVAQSIKNLCAFFPWPTPGSRILQVSA